MFAAKIDDPVHYFSMDKSMEKFLSIYLGAPASDAESARHSLLSHAGQSYALDMQLACDVISRFRLLDIFTRVLQVPCDNPPIFHRLDKPPSCPQRFQKVIFLQVFIFKITLIDQQLCNGVADWPEALLVFLRHYHDNRDEASSDHLPVTSGMTQEQRRFLAGLGCLMQAHRKYTLKQLDKILYNILVAAFAVWWITNVGSQLSVFMISADCPFPQQSFLQFPRNAEGLIAYFQG